ncbi:MAG: hypothetical protein E7504_08600 [Ruminococcus sp.]|nr:hypothetical protein [Ruminococcus sp.]
MYEVKIKNGGMEELISELDVNSHRRLAACTFTGEINKIPSCTFTVLPQNPCYDKLTETQTEIAVQNTQANKTEFEGRILKITNKMSSSGVIAKNVICEGYMAYLCDTVQPYRVYTDTDVSAFLLDVLAWHNSLVPEEKHIHLGMCDMHGTAEKVLNYGKTLDEIKRNLVDVLGGEIRIRKADGKLYLDYMKKLGTVSSTRVELARNLMDLSVECDATNVITRLIPLGARLNDETEERLTIASTNADGRIWIDDAKAVEKYGIICGTVTFDDCTNPAELRERGAAYLQQNNRIKKAYRATVLDLSTIGKDAESFCEGNTYHFFQPLMGIDEPLRIMKRTVDIYKPYKPAVEIGDKVEKMTDLATKTYDYIQYAAPKQKTEILAAAKANATAQIKAGINGYVVVNENEILIMDTPDKATATKVWRWNAGGFAYSSTGYDGDYGNAAITMDGAIVADFISGGVLRGVEILNGDGSFHVTTDGTVIASNISITGGSVKVKSTDDEYVVISAESGNHKTRFTPNGINTDGSLSGNALILPGFNVGDLRATISMENVYLTAYKADKTLPQALRDIETRLTNGGL